MNEVVMLENWVTENWDEREKVIYLLAKVFRWRSLCRVIFINPLGTKGVVLSMFILWS